MKLTLYLNNILDYYIQPTYIKAFRTIYLSDTIQTVLCWIPAYYGCLMLRTKPSLRMSSSAAFFFSYVFLCNCLFLAVFLYFLSYSQVYTVYWYQNNSDGIYCLHLLKIPLNEGGQFYSPVTFLPLFLLSLKVSFRKNVLKNTIL